MNFAPGTVLIHPSHGPMSVVSVSNRKFPDGSTRECVDLETLDTHTLAVTVPIDRYVEVGLRNVITGGELSEVIDTLGGPTGDEPENWSRRFKANEEKLRTGSIIGLAEVVRDILRRNEEKRVSLGERRILDRGMSQLSRELYYSKDMESIEAAEEFVRTAALAGQPVL